MTMRGLVLISLCLANVLAVQGECCKCDCQQSGLHQSHLYYLPIAPSYISTSGYGVHQSLEHVPALNIAQYAQGEHKSGYQSTGSILHYQDTQTDDKSLDITNKLESGIFSLEHERTQHQQPSFSYKGQGPVGLDLESSVSNANLEKEHVSKVSTHQGNHYINIEKKVIPHKTSSNQDGNSLDDEKDHHHHHDHGKNDYYKFEYGVNDHHTHDIKSHKEEKKGDVVQGEYSLLEDNGNVRTVKYYADWKTGFHAQVHNSKKTALG